MEMDFFNNHQGRAIAIDNNYYNLDITDEEISNEILQALFDGILKYINALGVLVYTNN